MMAKSTAKPSAPANISTPPSPSPKPVPPTPLLSQIVDFLVVVAGNLVLMVISAVIIHNYQITFFPTPSSSQITSFTKPFIHPSFPSFVSAPNTTVATTAVLIFVAALSSFPPPPHTDYYQGHFLVAALLGANLYTSTFELGGESNGAYLAILKSVLPGTVLVATVVSLSVHAVGRAWASYQAMQEELFKRKAKEERELERQARREKREKSGL